MATRTIATKLSLDGEKEWRSQMASVNSALKTLRSELDLSSSEFRGQANSMAALTAKQEILQRQYDQQRQKVEDLRAALAEAEKVYADSPEKVDKYQRMLNTATVQLNKMDDELQANRKLMDEAAESQDGCAKSIDEFGKAVQESKDKSLGFADILKANLTSDAVMSGLKGLASTMKEIGDKMAKVAMEGIDLASDLSEARNVIDTTFGEEGAAKIYEWSEAAAEAYGISNLNAQRYTGTLGAMLKSMNLSDDAVLDMSTSMVGLAGDMASFYNLDVDTAFEKLRAGISGETEPLKQLGINMSVANLEAYALSQGIETAYNEMTQAEQATLRYNYLMQATADAQGDFADTSDSYANQQKILELNIENLKTALGEQLLPSVTEVTAAFNDLLTGNIDITEFIDRLFGLNEVTETFRDFAPAVAAGTAALIAYKAASTLSKTLEKLREATGAQTTAQALLNAVMGANPMVKIVTLIGAVVAALATLWVTNEGFREAVTGAWNALRDAAVNVFEGIKNAFAAVGDKFAEIKAMIETKIAEFISIGTNIVEGIWEGISGGYTWIKNKIQGWVGDVVGFFKRILGINSPSTVMRDQIGKFMGEGVTEGFIENIDAQAMQAAIPTSFDIAAQVNSVGRAGYAGTYLEDMPYGVTGISNADALALLKNINGDLAWIKANGMTIVLDDGTIVGRWLPLIDEGLGQMAIKSERGS